MLSRTVRERLPSSAHWTTNSLLPKYLPAPVTGFSLLSTNISQEVSVVTRPFTVDWIHGNNFPVLPDDSWLFSQLNIREACTSTYLACLGLALQYLVWKRSLRHKAEPSILGWYRYCSAWQVPPTLSLGEFRTYVPLHRATVCFSSHGPVIFDWNTTRTMYVASFVHVLP